MVSRPESWKEVSLGDVAYELAGSVNPLVTPNQLFTEYSMPAFDNRKKATVVPGSAMLSARRRVIEPCVLVNKLNIRKRRVWSVLHPEENAVSSFEFVPLASSVLDLEFLQYVALSDEFTAFLEAHTSGTSNSQKRVSANVILSYLLQFPSLTEQRAIAEVLSGFDEHLANLDELITKKKAIRDGALDELLTGKQRLFGFNEGWSSLALEEVAAIYDGVHQTPDYEASGIRFVSVEDVFDLYGSAKFISQTSYLRDFKVHPSKGDVLMTRIGDIGTPAYISDEEPLAYYVSLALLKPIRISGLFLYYYIQSKSFQRELFDRSLLHATPKKINKGEIGFCLVTMPRNLEEQRAIAEVLFGMDEEIRLLAEERAKVERLKLGAMDDLLTGRVRLPLGKEAV